MPAIPRLRRRSLRRSGAAALLLAAGWWFAPAAGQASGDACLRDRISLQVVDREVLATSGSGGVRTMELRRGEFVLASESRGCVAGVSTRDRFLAISSERGAWQEIRYQVGEASAQSLLAGDSLIVALTDRRVLLYDALRDQLHEEGLSPSELVIDARMGDKVGAVATQRRLLGYAPELSGFLEKKLRLDENIEAMLSASDAITVTTPYRVLVLRSGSGMWSERARTLE